jgi:hypothetical protein
MFQTVETSGRALNLASCFFFRSLCRRNYDAVLFSRSHHKVPKEPITVEHPDAHITGVQQESAIVREIAHRWRSAPGS